MRSIPSLLKKSNLNLQSSRIIHHVERGETSSFSFIWILRRLRMTKPNHCECSEVISDISINRPVIRPIERNETSRFPRLQKSNIGYFHCFCSIDFLHFFHNGGDRITWLLLIMIIPLVRIENHYRCKINKRLKHL